MKKNKRFIIILLFVQSIFTSFPVMANQLEGRDVDVFNQAMSAMDEKNWQLAQSLFSGLYNQFPENIIISNNLAVAFFNLGQLEKSQHLLSSIIEQNKLTATAYKNLKTLYSYSAAKTYSKGLNLLKPIKLPELLVLNQELNEQLSKDVITNKNSMELPLKKELAVNILAANDIDNNLVADDSVTTKVQIQSEIEDDFAKQNQLKKSSEAVPSVAKTKPKVNQDTAPSDLLIRLEQWRQAWIFGNSKDYIAMYKKRYSPRGKSRKAWVKNRKQKVNTNKQIKVLINNPKVFVNKEKGRANIRFDQHYSSKNYTDQVQKRLYWIKEQGQWVIEKESIIKIM
ncbi:MAG: tetratricopeptide repeat protein [Pseudomonadota bacterium]